MSRTACLNGIYELAKIDKRVVFIGSDLSANTLLDFKRDFPDRFFMEGIQEQNIIGFAAGLAMEGFIPYVNTIATFLTRRAYEQIALDVAAHNLPVRLVGNGGGLVYAGLGPTHCATDDIALMRLIPGMSIVCCSDSEEMKQFMPSTLNDPGPMYIRLGKDSDPVFRPKATPDADILFISTGIMSYRCMQIAEALPYKCEVRHVPIIKPIILEDLDVYGCIVTVEEGVKNGGLGSAVLEFAASNHIDTPILRFGLPDAFPHHYGEQEDLLETYGLTIDKMSKKIKEFYESL